MIFLFLNTNAFAILRTIVPLANRSHRPRRDCARVALHTLARSAQDSGEAVDANGDGVHRHGRRVDDLSAAAVLREEVWRQRDQYFRRASWHWFYRGVYDRVIYGRAVDQRADVGPVLRSRGTQADIADCTDGFGNRVPDLRIRERALVTTAFAHRAGRGRWNGWRYSGLRCRLDCTTGDRKSTRLN